jgi:hypothetical protein
VRLGIRKVIHVGRLWWMLTHKMRLLLRCIHVSIRSRTIKEAIWITKLTLGRIHILLERSRDLLEGLRLVIGWIESFLTLNIEIGLYLVDKLFHFEICPFWHRISGQE